MILLFKINNINVAGVIMVEFNKEKLMKVLLQIDKEYGHEPNV